MVPAIHGSAGFYLEFSKMMLVAEKRTVEPVIEPVSLTEAKAHAVVETTDYDADITSKLKTAREWCESVTNRALVEQTWRYKLDEFPYGNLTPHASRREYLQSREIRLGHSPLISVSSIQYVDTSGATQTLATSKYVVDTDSEPCRIAESYGNEWPNTYPELNSVTITAVHGYITGSPLDTGLCPEPIRQAIMFLCAEMYQNRIQHVVGLEPYKIHTVEQLLAPYKVRGIFD